MDGPIISFDVSKGSSHMRGFLKADSPEGKPARIGHDREGFGKIADLATRIGKKAGKRPAAVLEATGVYSMPIVAYLLSEGYTVYMVSPLESARMRKSEVRPVKNDRIDTTTIARVYYSRTLREFSPQTGKLARLREMASHYRFLVEKGSMERNRFRRCLDAVWPGFDEVLAYDSDVALAVVRRFRHPSRVKKAESVSKGISKCRCGKGGSRDRIAGKVVEYAGTHVSGVDPDSHMVDELVWLAGAVEDTSRDIEELLGRMEGLCSGLPEYEVLKTIPSAGGRLGVRLLAGIGDICRFESAKALVAYAGLDPMVMQSGRQTGEHMHITKKGDAFLRATLYLLVVCICRHHPDSRIAKYVSDKRKGGLSLKAARIAGCNKLARTIYAMLTRGTVYSEG